MANLPRTPAEAKRLGLSRYYTGKPCPKGHDSPRLARTADCLICRREAKKRNALLHPERRRARNKRWIVKQKLDPVRNHKRHIRYLVYYAIKCGILTPSPCKCGNPDTEAHHPDYSKPLEVEWVCRPCHQKIHAVTKS